MHERRTHCINSQYLNCKKQKQRKPEPLKAQRHKKNKRVLLFIISLSLEDKASTKQTENKELKNKRAWNQMKEQRMESSALTGLKWFGIERMMERRSTLAAIPSSAEKREIARQREGWSSLLSLLYSRCKKNTSTLLWNDVESSRKPAKPHCRFSTR